MNYTRQRVKDTLSGELNRVLSEMLGETTEVELEVPRESGRGAFASTAAMQLAGRVHKNPRVIAEEIVENFDTSGIEEIDSIEIAGPGFINFQLKPGWDNATVTDILRERENFGKSTLNAGKTYNIEFVSANPTGPMHIGNARGGAIGDVLAAIAEWTGYDVTREFYINDAGNQMEKFGESLEARFLEKMGEEVDFPEDGYQGKDITERVEEYLDTLTPEEIEKLKRENTEARRKTLRAYAKEQNINAMRKDLEDYGVDYDVWFSEQSLYDTGQIDEVLARLRESGHTYEKDGAVWFKTTDFGLEKDDVLVRENGIPTYFLGDIAYHVNKFSGRGFDKGIDVWGADHHGHVARLQAALKALGLEDRLEVVLMQLVKLISNDKLVRLSKRKGQAVGLMELVNAIGLDAARFFFNTRSPDSHFEFDLDLAIKESNENPVFYVQYAHARIASILRKLENVEIENVDLSLLCKEEEYALIDVLSRFPEEIVIAEKTSDPSRLTRYAMDTAGAFHSFYNAHRVNVEEEELKRARTALVVATKQVLQNVLGLLGISAPERM